MSKLYKSMGCRGELDEDGLPSPFCGKGCVQVKLDSHVYWVAEVYVQCEECGALMRHQYYELEKDTWFSDCPRDARGEPVVPALGPFDKIAARKTLDVVTASWKPS